MTNKTRFAELGYEKLANNLWRVIATDTGCAVGPHYRTKSELLGDFTRYASESWGLPDYDPTPYCHVCDVMDKEDCTCLPIAANN